MKLPLAVVSEDAPSETFSAASALWNETPTTKNEATIALPIVAVMYNIGESRLMKGPNFAAKSLGALASSTRLQVAERPNAFYPGRFTEAWRRVTVMEGPLAGKVGWILATTLVKGDA